MIASVTNNLISEDINFSSGMIFDASTGSSVLNNTIWATGTAAKQIGIRFDGVTTAHDKGCSLVANILTDVQTVPASAVDC